MKLLGEVHKILFMSNDQHEGQEMCLPLRKKGMLQSGRTLVSNTVLDHDII